MLDLADAGYLRRIGYCALHRPDQPGRPVADDQQRTGQAPLAQVGQERLPRVGRFAGSSLQPDEDGFAVGVDAPRGQHRLCGGVRVVCEMRSVQEHVVQLDLVETTRAPAVELGGGGLTDPRDRGLRPAGLPPSASIRVATTSRVDNPRTNPAMTRLSNALVLLTPAQQPGGTTCRSCRAASDAAGSLARSWS